MRQSQTRRSTAYHEAGHAVIARVLAYPSGEATIKPDYAKRTAGSVVTASPYCCEHEWVRRRKVRGNNAALHARIMIEMAGAETEAVLLKRVAIGDAEDRKQIGAAARELCHPEFWEGIEPRLRRMTRMLIRRHRVAIKRAAEALISKTTLSAAELDRLVGRSINDVKANAPILLTLSRSEGKAAR